MSDTITLFTAVETTRSQAPASPPEAVSRLTPEDREMLDVLEEKTNLVRARVRSVAQGRTPGLFVHGTGGIGKSHTVLGELDRINAEYRLHNGQMTGRGLYDALADAPEAVHVLEDLESMYGNKQVQNLLRSACWGQERDGRMRRPMSWQCKNAPDPFLFEGGVIILSNRPLRDIPELQAVATRLNPVELHVTDREIAAKMREVALDGHRHGAESLTPDQCAEVAEFVIRESLEAGRSLDMRILKNASNDRLQYESGDRAVHWHDLVRSRMQGRVVVARREGRAERVGREREVALSIADLPRAERAARWAVLTGLSEKALYRRLAG